MIKKLIKFFFNYYGFKLSRISDQSLGFFDHLKTALKIYNINTIIDVGANIGQFSTKIINLNYKNELILVEPTKKTFGVLKKNILKLNKRKEIKNIEFHNLALGLKTSEEYIHKSTRGEGMGDMNSLLKISESGEKLVKNSKQIDKELVQVVNINEFLKQKINLQNNIMLKLDIEGLDFALLKNIDFEILKKITFIMIEVHMHDNIFFEGQSGDLIAVNNFLVSNNFILYNIDPGWSNKPTGQLIFSDCLYVNNNSKAINLDLNFNEKIGNPKIYN